MLRLQFDDASLQIVWQVSIQYAESLHYLVAYRDSMAWCGLMKCSLKSIHNVADPRDLM